VTFLVNFSVLIYDLSKLVEKEYFGNYLIHQLLRSSAGAALNYGEAQGAESKKDLIHKSSIVLKELRETHISLKIINDSQISNDSSGLSHFIG